MTTAYPGGLDSFATRTDDVDDVLASHVNDLQDAIVAVQAKVGVTGSGVTSTLEYLLKNAASVNPGHKHTLAALSLSGLTAGHALFASSATACAFRKIAEADINDDAILARVGANETIIGGWTFSGTRPVFKQGIELGGAGSESVTHAAAAGAGTVAYAWPSTFSAGQYLMVGVGGALSWGTPAGGGSGGWQDDGTVVRPATLSDQVAIGTASPVAGTRLQVSAQSASDVLTILKHAATPTGSWLQARRSDDTVAVEITTAGAVKLKNTQALAVLPTSAGSLLSYSTGSSGYLVIEADAEGNFGTGAHCAVKFFSDTTAFFGDIPASQTASGGQVIIQPRAANVIPLIIRGKASQSNNLLVFQDSSLNILGSIRWDGWITAPRVSVSGGGGLYLYGALSGFSAFQAPPSGGSVTYTLPSSDGASGQVLGTNGAGQLSWVSGGGGGSALSTIAAATANNSIANGSFTQTWQWALGATTNVAMTLAESAAASNTSTLLKIAGVTGSTATLLAIAHPDVNAKALDIDGGVARIKTKYLSIGPSAPWITTAGSGTFDALVRFTGTFGPNPSGYASTMRVAAFTSSDLKYALPTNPPTNMGQQVVFYGIHCGYEASGLWSSSYTSGYSLYGVDMTLDVGQNVPDFHTMVAVGCEVNWNYTDTAASNMTACCMASINGWQSSTRNSRMAAFWLRPSSGMTYTAEFTLPSNKTLYGLLTPPISILSPIPYYRWRPFHIAGTSGQSFHGPRMDFGSNLDGYIGGAFSDDATNYQAAVTIVGQNGRTVSDEAVDHVILALIDNNANKGRTAFYRAGGMRLCATASAGPPALLGSLYVNSGDSKLYFHNGSSWLDLTSAGGGGGWQDNGTTVSLTTNSDKVSIGFTPDGIVDVVAKHLFIYNANGATALAIRQSSGSITEDFCRFLSNGGGTLFAVAANGATTTVGPLNHLGSAGGLTCHYVETNSSGWANLIVGNGTSKRGTNLQNGLVLCAGQAPSTSPADCVAIYAKDATAGNCWPVFKAEDGIERFILGVESVNTSLSTGVGSIKLAGTTNRDNVGFLKTHREDGSTVYVPYYTNIN